MHYCTAIPQPKFAFGIIPHQSQAPPSHVDVPAAVPLCRSTIDTVTLSTNKLLDLALMSYTYPTAASSSSSSSPNFQLIINNALDTYKTRTGKDLLAHPLAARLQNCDSPTAILSVLQQQVQGPDQTRSTGEWTKWLDPTVNVLSAFSDILGAGVSLVCFRTCTSHISFFLY